MRSRGPSTTLEKEQALAVQLAERIRANHRREQAATEISALSAGLGPLLLAHRQALPDLKVYRTQGATNSRSGLPKSTYDVCATSTRRRVSPIGRQPWPHSPPDCRAEQTDSLHETLQALIAQRQALLSQQLETEAMYLERLRKLRAAESDLLETARVATTAFSKSTCSGSGHSPEHSSRTLTDCRKKYGYCSHPHAGRHSSGRSNNRSFHRSSSG
jgi:hypothetical protein